MQEAPPSIGLPEQTEGPHNARGRRPLVIVAVAVTVAVIVSATTFLVLRDGQEPAPSGAAAPPSPKVTGLVTTTPTQPSAMEDLAAFLSAAATLDGQLHEAAAAINAAGPPWTDVDPELADLVSAAELEPVAQAVPAGLPPDLLQSVILVYSDLASRRYAMASFEITPPETGLSRGEILEQVLLSELGNGHEAAARFDADLAATRSLAVATPPIAAVPADSRLVAEKLLLVQFVGLGNAGCNARGGVVLTELPVITWAPPSWNPDADGTIGRPGSAIDFNADFGPDGTWHIAINAC
jgi:hypothetical protein